MSWEYGARCEPSQSRQGNEPVSINGGGDNNPHPSLASPTWSKTKIVWRIIYDKLK